MSPTCPFSGAVVTILAIFMCTASQCRGQSDHPNLQIRQEKMANDGTSAPITVVGVATIEEPTSYNFTCQRLDGADGSNLQWEYVDEPTRTLQMTRVNNGVDLTLSNVGEDAVGLYRCKDGSTNEAEELLLTMDNPAVLPVKSNISLLENSSLHLAVYSSGDPIEKVRYKWRMNDVQIANANLSADMREATIPSVQFQGDVQYSCMVDLQVGVFFKKQFAYFFVTVYVPPVIIKSPADATIDEHSNVTLECRATGNPPPVITWTHNGVTIGDEEGIVNLQESNGSTSLPVVRSTYTLTGVQYEDRGAYRCVASIPAEELGLEPAELTSESQEAALVVHAELLLERRVGDQKEQLTESVIVITEMGSEVVVTCSGSGTLEWVGPSGAALPRSSNNTVRQEYDDIVGSQVLTITSFTLNFSGNYTCKSSVPNLEKSILITMDNPAVFPVEPVVYAPRGTTAILMVTVSSTPRPTEDNVVWYYKGSRIVPDQRHSFASTNQKLTISGVERGDYGEYTCEVNTTAGSDSATITLREPSLPTVTVLPSSPITTVLDQKVIANCTGSGSGQLEVTWTKEGTTGLPEGAIATPEGILMIASALEVHGGMYTCVVKNVAGSANVRLEVIVHVPPKVEVETGRPRTNPPTLIKDESNLVYSEGTEHELLCSATGVPTPTLSWLYKGVSVGDNQVTGTNPRTLSWDGPLSTNHSGTYTCRAENEVATVTSTFILTVRPRTIPGSDVHVQLRILTKDCTKWSPEQLALARASVASIVYNNTLARCGCSFEIHQFSSHSLVCSYEVRDAVSFRAIIVSTSEVRASSIYAAFSSWARTGPTIVILGMEAQLDTSCDPLADSATSPECPVDDGSSSSMLEPWLIAVIGTSGAVCLIAVVVVAVSSCCCCYCCCRKTGMYNIYTKNMRRSFSFQPGPLHRESVEDAPGHDYVMDSITEPGGRNHMYDQPENVRRESEACRSTGGVILVGSSSENNSNTGGYSMLHPDDEEDQVASPTQQSQFSPPPIPPHGSFLSGVPASSFTQVTTLSSVKASETPLYAEVQDNGRKTSVQDRTPNAAPISPNSNQGDGQNPIADMWYQQSVEDLLQGYSLSQPAYYNTSNEPLEYENPLPAWSKMGAASQTVSNQQVRRAASQKHSGRMMPQLPSGLRTALV